MATFADLRLIRMDVAPFRLSGAVYGALLNHRTALCALGDQIGKPPYNGAPKAPVLQIKPRNTFALCGDFVPFPAAHAELDVAASVGLVIGRSACRVAPEDALNHVAGYLIVVDVSIPCASHYRPQVRFKACDGFCPLGSRVTARANIANPDALEIRTRIDGVLEQTANSADLIRPAAQLLAAVSEFMTLSPGDVLATGAAAAALRVRPGQTVLVEIDGLDALSNRFLGIDA